MDPMKYINKGPNRFIPKAIDLSSPAVKKFIRVKSLITLVNFSVTFGVLGLLYIWGVL